MSERSYHLQERTVDRQAGRLQETSRRKWAEKKDKRAVLFFIILLLATNDNKPISISISYKLQVRKKLFLIN